MLSGGDPLGLVGCGSILFWYIPQMQDVIVFWRFLISSFFGFFWFVCFFGERGVCQSKIHVNFTTQDFPRTPLPNKTIGVIHLTFQWFKCCLLVGRHGLLYGCCFIHFVTKQSPKSPIYSYPIKLLIVNTLFSVIFLSGFSLTLKQYSTQALYYGDEISLKWNKGGKK